MLPDVYLDELILGVFNGTYSPFKLPEFVYYFTVDKLDQMFLSGFGKVELGQVKETEKAIHYRGNVGRFSGAKTWQNVNDLTNFVFTEEGKKRPFAEFKEMALKIDKKYNTNWLAAEQDTVFLQSQNARKWLKFESESEIFPVLQYITVGDDRVRDSHKRLDGLKLHINDPLWNEIMPQNGWRCRCQVIQLEETRTATAREKNSHTKLIKKEFKKNSEFSYNPGKTEYIYKETGKGKHDYFKVPREFSKDLKNNFGFPSVEEATGRAL